MITNSTFMVFLLEAIESVHGTFNLYPSRMFIYVCYWISIYIYKLYTNTITIYIHIHVIYKKRLISIGAKHLQFYEKGGARHSKTLYCVFKFWMVPLRKQKQENQLISWQVTCLVFETAYSQVRVLAALWDHNRLPISYGHYVMCMTKHTTHAKRPHVGETP